MSEATLRRALEDIYDSARYVFDGSLADGLVIRAGYCRWCGAPPPDDAHDHDVVCPAAKAGYALDKPGYHDWRDAAERMWRAPV